MKNKNIVDEIEKAIVSSDYDLAKKKIEELDIDPTSKDSLKTKVDELKSEKEKTYTIGGLRQEDIADADNYEDMNKKLQKKIAEKQTNFIVLLNRTVR